MRRELDRVKRVMDQCRLKGSDWQGQLIEARSGLGAKKEECRRLRDELQDLKGTLEALSTPEGWRQRLDECRSENWRLQRAVGAMKNDVDARAGELEALREEVRTAQFAEMIQRDRAEDMKEELVSVRVASVSSESEEDAAFREALPFLFEQANYWEDQCRKPLDKRRPYPSHCP
jgi:chromosome segregation ATPase